jgi:hypothetical protein
LFFQTEYGCVRRTSRSALRAEAAYERSCASRSAPVTGAATSDRSTGAGNGFLRRNCKRTRCAWSCGHNRAPGLGADALRFSPKKGFQVETPLRHTYSLVSGGEFFRVCETSPAEIDFHHPPPMNNVRLGLIGLGNIGKYHADYLLDQKVARCELVAL